MIGKNLSSDFVLQKVGRYLNKSIFEQTCFSLQLFHEKDRCPEQSKEIDVEQSTLASRSWKEDKSFGKNKNVRENLKEV